jgi:hypothetical protein
MKVCTWFGEENECTHCGHCREVYEANKPTCPKCGKQSNVTNVAQIGFCENCASRRGPKRKPACDINKKRRCINCNTCNLLTNA